MNSIQQLQQTLKWKEFEEWYKKNYHWEGYQSESFNRFIDSKIEFTKGVFEKFIESQEGVFEQTSNADFSNRTYSIWTLETGYKKSKSFEELLIWYFNN